MLIIKIYFLLKKTLTMISNYPDKILITKIILLITTLDKIPLHQLKIIKIDKIKNIHKI